MANLIRSLGYSLGKVHTGMISYLCELHREGNKEPLESFLTALGVNIPNDPVSRREWNSVDLAILEKNNENQMEPVILIELKVDDRETGSNPENYQTVRYAKKWPSCRNYLFITLGRGEYYHAPRSNRFSWVRIRDFLKALEAIKTRDSVIIDWIEEIKHEIFLQDNVLIADKSHAAEYRHGAWNIYLFGHLAEKLSPDFAVNNLDVEVKCYTYGSRPDTIMNFGWSQKPLYMEINYSGRLNLKMSLDASKSKDSRREDVNREIANCEKLSLGDRDRKFHSDGKIGRSKTIVSFDVGLADIDKDGFLLCQPSFDKVRENIFSLVKTFYGRQATT